MEDRPKQNEKISSTTKTLFQQRTKSKRHRRIKTSDRDSRVAFSRLKIENSNRVLRSTTRRCEEPLLKNYISLFTRGYSKKRTEYSNKDTGVLESNRSSEISIGNPHQASNSVNFDQCMHEYSLHAIDFDDLDLDSLEFNSLSDSPLERTQNHPRALLETPTELSTVLDKIQHQTFANCDGTKDLRIQSQDVESLINIAGPANNNFDVLQDIIKEGLANKMNDQQQNSVLEELTLQLPEIPLLSKCPPDLESFDNLVQQNSKQKPTSFTNHVDMNSTSQQSFSQFPVFENNLPPKSELDLGEQPGHRYPIYDSVLFGQSCNRNDFQDRSQIQTRKDDQLVQKACFIPCNYFDCTTESSQLRQNVDKTQLLPNILKPYSASTTPFTESYLKGRFKNLSCIDNAEDRTFTRIYKNNFEEMNPRENVTSLHPRQNEMSNNTWKTIQEQELGIDDRVTYGLNPSSDSPYKPAGRSVFDTSKFFQNELTTSCLQTKTHSQSSSSYKLQRGDSVIQDRNLVSGGSIERAFSPVLSNQNFNFKYISVPFTETNFLETRTDNQELEGCSLSGYKIHLVQTPPPLNTIHRKDDSLEKNTTLNCAPPTVHKSKRRSRAEMINFQKHKAGKQLDTTHNYRFSPHEDLLRMKQHYSPEDLHINKEPTHYQQKNVSHGTNIYSAKQNDQNEFPSCSQPQFGMRTQNWPSYFSSESWKSSEIILEPKAFHQGGPGSFLKLTHAKREQDSLNATRKRSPSKNLKQQQRLSHLNTLPTSQLSVKSYEQHPQRFPSNLQREMTKINQEKIPLNQVSEPFLSTPSTSSNPSTSKPETETLHKKLQGNRVDEHWTQMRSNTLNTVPSVAITNDQGFQWTGQDSQPVSNHLTQAFLKNSCPLNCYCQYESQLYSINQNDSSVKSQQDWDQQFHVSQNSIRPVQNNSYSGPSCQVRSSKEKRPHRTQIVPNHEQWLPPTPTTSPPYEINFQNNNLKWGFHTTSNTSATTSFNFHCYQNY